MVQSAHRARGDRLRLVRWPVDPRVAWYRPSTTGSAPSKSTAHDGAHGFVEPQALMGTGIGR